jgi:phosphoglycolate phosphatase
MAVKAILFDVDGTLIDNTAIIVEKHRLAARQLGLPEKNFADYASCVATWEEKLGEMWPGVDVEKFKKAFREAPHTKCGQVPGGTSAVQELARKGYVLGIVSNKLSSNTFNHLREAGYDPAWFEFIHGEDNVVACKPDPRAFDKALAELGKIGVSKSEAVYVGDSLMDMGAAERAGITFIAVLTGFGKREEFNGVTALNSVAELPKALT